MNGYDTLQFVKTDFFDCNKYQIDFIKLLLWGRAMTIGELESNRHSGCGFESQQYHGSFLSNVNNLIHEAGRMPLRWPQIK